MFQVGDAVEVRKYEQAHGERSAWRGGYVARAVEFEDYVVERDGMAFAIGSDRVRAAEG